MEATEKERCEARYWLRLGYNTPARVEDLRTMLRRHRPPKAIEQLIDLMRIEWQKQKAAK